MIRHLFKLVWNRKRINALITVEIFFTFIILFAVITTTVYQVRKFYQPIGFNHERVWSVWPDSKLPWGHAYAHQRNAGKDQLFRAMRDLPEIESVAGISTTPYGNSTWTNDWDQDGRNHRAELAMAGDDLAHVLGLHIVQGRWFEGTDDAAIDEPVVINQRLSRELFGNDTPIGKYLDTSFAHHARIVGVIDEFRKGGEFYAPDNFVFRRLKMNDTSAAEDWGFVIKLREGVDASFQGKLAGVLGSVEKTWSFDITPLDRLRDEDFQLHLAPLIAAGLIAGFLLLMVGLGLIGVLWQNVSQRTQEIGLRRAVGGSATMVYRQVLGELFVIATIGILAATAIVLQAPLLNLLDFVSADVYVIGLAISFALIYLLTFISGVYPSWLAMEIHPSEALHYE